MPTPVNTVIFDLGRVLVDFDFELAFRRLAGRSPYGAAEALRIVSDAGLIRRTNLGTLDPWNFYLGVRELLRLEPDVDFHDFRAAYGCIFTGKPEMADLLQALLPRYRVGLLSNIDLMHRHAIDEQFPYVHLPPVRVFSYELGLRKPDAAIYHETLRRLGAAAAESVFIDDRPENVAGAEAVGMHGVLFSGRPALEAALLALGVDGFRPAPPA